MSVDLHAKYFHVKEIFVNFTISQKLRAIKSCYKEPQLLHVYDSFWLSLSFHKYCSHVNTVLKKKIEIEIIT